MDFPENLRYTDDDEWLRQEDGEAVVGITDYAQDQLGDVVFVELPEVGRRLQRGETFGAVESVKAVSDLYAPVSGEVIARNEQLESTPELLNQDPYGEGWLIRVRVDDESELDQLLSAETYRTQREDGDSR